MKGEPTMASRNADRIKELETELGRYRKKVDDQNKELSKLRQHWRMADQGVKEISMTLDAILISLALQFGKGTDLRKTLTIDQVDFLTLHENYTVTAKRTKAGKYTVTVKKRGEVKS
jgi:hypothetical protein